MGPSFHQTRMGQEYYEGTMVLLLKAAQSIAVSADVIAKGIATQNDSLDSLSMRLMDMNEVLGEIDTTLEKRGVRDNA